MIIGRKILICYTICLGFLNSNAQSRVQELNSTQYNKNIVINFLITAGNSCSGYQILKSSDSLNFSILHDYAGICGESTKSQNITFTDEFPEKIKKIITEF